MECLGFEKLLEFETTVVDILRFYIDYQENWNVDDDVIEKIFKKLFKVATKQETVIISLLAENDHYDLREAAEKIVNPPAAESAA